MVGDSRFRRLARYAFFCQHNILYSGRELCSHHFGVDFTWQTVPSFIYAAAVAVFLVLYYVGLVKERKGKQKDI